MRGGLLLRTGIASGVLAIVVGGAFAVLLIAVADLRASARMAARSQVELDAADRLERLVIDMETGQRGYVITRNPGFLQPFNAARAAFPGQLAALERYEVNRGQARRLRTIAQAVGAYVNDYSLPLINETRRGSALARSVAATEEGRRRIDAIRAEFDSYRANQLALLNMRQGRDDALTRRAVITAAVGLAGSIVLIVLIGGYLARVLVLPVRRSAGMATRLAGGDLAVRVPETGTGETRALERAFNSMAGALENGRDELRRLVEEQSALRRVATLVARGVSPTHVFDAVATETLELMGADSARVCCYEPDASAVVVADRSKHGTPVPVGLRLTLEGESVTASVWRTGRPGRRDTLEGVTGSIAALARERGLRSAVGAPIVVQGRLWGVIVAYWTRVEPLPADAEDRIAEFAELVGVAIANADAHNELVASRARVLAAGDDARRRVVRDLHDGAQQRLIHTIVTLKLAGRALRRGEDSVEPLVAQALDHAEDANNQLHDLAHGILPSVLTRGGLPAAVESLACTLTVPVSVDVSVERLAPEIEASLYFVVAEALTNITKHSHAHSAGVKAWVADEVLHLNIRDDGVGGAHADGAGLVGLADRVAVLGGRLHVESPPDGGTLIAATLPLSPGGLGPVGP